MTDAPTLVLTRPRAASERIAALFPGASSVISPVLDIVGTGETVNLARYRGLILTSANVVPFLPDLSGVPVYCVGERTADISGGVVQLVAQDAEDLVERLQAEGPLLHAHGRETRGNIAERLTLAGIETHSVVLYDQVARELSDAAKAAIAGPGPVLLPLWSPRSAKLVGKQVSVGTRTQVLALSSSVAEAWENATGRKAVVCSAPTAEAMTAQIVAILGL